MPSLARMILALAFGLSILWSVLAPVALLRVRLRKRRQSGSSTPGSREPISVLKPLAGCDQALEANLRTCFEQTHPAFELVFGIQDPGDPALELVRRLKAAYPSVTSSIVIHDGRGMNPKVSNLRAMLTAVRHDLVVICDSNIAVTPGWLEELACELDRPNVGLVFNPIAGVGEETLGAALESSQLNGPVIAGTAILTELCDHPAVVGKSILFRRSSFERLGGFESVASVLAEDYVIGRIFQTAGYSVRMAPTPVHNVGHSTTVRAFFARQLRWAMLRVRLQPFAYVLEPCTSPFLIGLIAAAAGFGPGSFVAGLSMTLARDAVLFRLVRGPRGLLRTLPLLPLREALTLAAWLAAPFCRHVSWRGHRLRLSLGTRLYAERPLSPQGPLRVES